MSICAVPTKNVNFKRGVSEYALLHLGGTVPQGVATITRLFDNEDHDNKNHVGTKYDGKLFAGNIGQCTIGDKNTRLAFLYYESEYTPDAFPALGISYGVFGQIQDSQNYFKTDDENGKNMNQCYITRGSVRTDVAAAAGKIMDVGGDTRLYVSPIR